MPEETRTQRRLPAMEGFEPDLRVVNVAAVPHRSPFRYPGGKTWLVPLTRRWLASLPKRPAELAEIFAGGAIVGLSALFENQVERLTLVERDEDVAAVWTAIFEGRAPELADRVLGFAMTRENVEAALRGEPGTLVDHAFRTLLRNRVLHGGILAPGASLMKAGENGKGLRSRWYPRTLADRILALHELRHRVAFIRGDGLRHMAENAGRPEVAFFVDPPYTVAGKRLYKYSQIDHPELLRVAAGVRGPLLATYDDAPPIRKLAEEQGLAIALVPMRNKRHALQQELLVAKSLDWLAAERSDQPPPHPDSNDNRSGA